MGINNFNNKQILITGAAVGIGKSTSVLLSKLGASLVLLDINEDGLKETVSCLSGVGHRYFRYDLSDLEGIESLIKTIISTCGPFDGLVHCAGIRCRRPLKLLTPHHLIQVMSLNFGSFVELVRCITKKGFFREGMSIVGISSISAQRGASGVIAYASSKAALDCAVRCLAKELSSKKIRLNTIAPAQINTPAYTDFIKMKGGAEDETLARQYLGLGEPEDIANTIVFLLSKSSRFITGAAIPVDGGFLSS
jgi:NAD(P)-dependent dehydrogenase (short-subunit alcohol dehydrogenase family)